MHNEKTTEENLLSAEIPEKFKHPETGEVQTDLLMKSYKELEKRLSQNPAAPKTPEDYCIDCSHGMFEVDIEINRRLHEKGFTQEQAQEVYNLASEKMVPMVHEIAADYKADREVEKLSNHFGGVEQWKEMSRQLLAFGRKNLPEDVLDNLSSSFEGVVALHRMMKGEEPRLQRVSAQEKQGVNDLELSSMMRDPRYWKDKDPAYIAKVTQGFENLYGN
ncbi:MAG: hypothetical protein COA45_07535 [Zetaproteobacteria bacterium]|nr:MAG: hypothetical protein COA45_07535 [Zetaproteobacteria bacterium]